MCETPSRNGGSLFLVSATLNGGDDTVTLRPQRQERKRLDLGSVEITWK